MFNQILSTEISIAESEIINSYENIMCKYSNYFYYL